MTHGIIGNSFELASESHDDSEYTYHFVSSSFAAGTAIGYSTSSSSNMPYTISSGDFVDITTISGAESYTANALSNMAAVGDLSFDYSSGTGDINISYLDISLYHPGYNYAVVGAFTGSYGTSIQSDVFVTQSTLPLDFVLAHELGHSIGLKDADATSLSGTENTQRFSIMSYNSHPGENRFVHELQLYDIASIQAMYGRAVHNDDDTTYSDFTEGSVARMFSIWDSDGNDTLDASGQSSAALIDLRPGYFSSIGPSTAVSIDITDNAPSVLNAGHMNISIAYGAYIENAIGTDHNDLIIGNVLDNVLEGGGGDDVIYAEGADAVYDAGDGDYRQISATASSHLEDAPTEISDYADDRSLQWDSLYGGDGDDLLFGGAGSDFLDGGDGNDWLSGGAGWDTVTFENLTEGLTLTLTGTTPAEASSGDTVIDVESVIGTAYNDVIDATGNSADNPHEGNELWGNAGSDILIGGDSADSLFGGDDNDFLDSGSNSSTIVAGSGFMYLDYLSGDEGDDILVMRGDKVYASGGLGSDQFWIEDTITGTYNDPWPSFWIYDSDSSDSLYWNGYQLTGGTKTLIDAELSGVGVTWRIAALDSNGFIYEWQDGSDRMVITTPDNTRIDISNFEEGDFGIYVDGAITGSEVTWDEDWNPITSLAISEIVFDNEMEDYENLSSWAVTPYTRGPNDTPDTFLV